MAFLRGHTSHWLTLDDDKPEFEMETALDVGIDDQANMEDSSPHIQEHAHNIRHRASSISLVPLGELSRLRLSEVRSYITCTFCLLSGKVGWVCHTESENENETVFFQAMLRLVVPQFC